ncbi:putative secondary metabolism biosynthetic enzyme, partial [Claviceps citrina]
MYTASDDVVFGATVTGRQAAIPGIERMVGPTIATVPVRVTIDWQARVEELLQTVQQQALDMAPFEQAGLQSIRKASSYAEMACRFQTLPVAQPADEARQDSAGRLFQTPEQEARQPQERQHVDTSSTYALTALCDLGKDGFNMMLRYDPIGDGPPSSPTIHQSAAALPLERLRDMVDQVRRRGRRSTLPCHLIVTSALQEELSRRLMSRRPMRHDERNEAIVVVGQDTFPEAQAQQQTCPSQKQTPASGVTPEDALYVVFTSASTAAIKLVGERLTKPTVDQWRHVETLINAYGPAENSVLSTLSHVTGDESQYPSIGKGCGTVTWVVSTRGGGGRSLAAIGEVGELWVEGPLVAKEYLDNPELTRERFVRDPPWLVQGMPDAGVPGRGGRLYRTGDLVSYHHHGSLHFAGRIDDQVKIRGQRVELGEVEARVRQSLAVPRGLEAQVVADVATPQGYPDPVLIAFISHGVRVSEDELAATLPAYMVPSLCLALEALPMTTTGKIDRRTLRRLAGGMTREQLAPRNMLGRRHRRVHRQPSTTAEKQLPRLWSEVLGLEPARIGADDSFVQLGGDSVQAMRLNLAAAAAAATPASGTLEPVKPFSLLPEGSTMLDGPVPPTTADAFPVTHLQASYIGAAVQEPPRSCSVFYLRLPRRTPVEDVVKTCGFAWSRLDVLRAAFVEHDGRYWQVIPSSGTPAPILVHELQAGDSDEEAGSSSLPHHELYRRALMPPLRLGSPYTQFLVSRSRGQLFLGIRLSHAQYDGISLGELVALMAAHLTGRRSVHDDDDDDDDDGTRPQFSHYMHFALAHETESLRYWSSLVRGSRPLVLSPGGSGGDGD